MSDNPQSSKTLEMRVAELEDKLAQTQITEADMKAFQKVSVAMAARGGAGAPAAATEPCVANTGAATPALNPQFCIISHCVIHNCIISHCVIYNCIITQCIIHPIINPIILNDCTCGPCAQANVAATPTAEKEFGDLGS